MVVQTVYIRIDLISYLYQFTFFIHNERTTNKTETSVDCKYSFDVLTSVEPFKLTMNIF